MSKIYYDLISCVKQQVKEYDNLYKYHVSSVSFDEIKNERFWVLAGIHQCALFVLSTEEYYKFKNECSIIEFSNFFSSSYNQLTFI